MPIVYFLGGSDHHVITEPAPAVFTRTADEPHPCAHVDQEAASVIVGAHPGLFALKGATEGSAATSNHVHALTTGTVPPPPYVEVHPTPTTRTRKAK